MKQIKFFFEKGRLLSFFSNEEECDEKIKSQIHIDFFQSTIWIFVYNLNAA